MNTTVKDVVQRYSGDFFVRSGWNDGRRNLFPVETENLGPCEHSPWDLYLSPCTRCYHLCNCFRLQDDEFPDILVLSMEKKMIRLSASFAKASIVLSELVNRVRKEKGNDSRLCTNSDKTIQPTALRRARSPTECGIISISTPQLFKLLVTGKVISGGEALRKGTIIEHNNERLMILFDQGNQPTVGVSIKTLDLIDRYIQKHLEYVIYQSKGYAGEMNSPDRESWEADFFDKDQNVILELLQANQDLLIWDFYCALIKWVVKGRGVPRDEVMFTCGDELESAAKYNFRMRKRYGKRQKPKMIKSNRQKSIMFEKKEYKCEEIKRLHSDWELHFTPFLCCGRLCNCSYTYFPKSYPDVYVRSLDRQIVRLSGEFVRASGMLSQKVDQLLAGGTKKVYFDPDQIADGERVCNDIISSLKKKPRLGEEYPVKDLVSWPSQPVLLLCDRTDIPTLGITKDVLEKLQYFINMHLDEVDLKVEAEKRQKFHLEEILVRYAHLISDEHFYVNTFAHKEWEEKLFNVDIGTLLSYKQANVELKILDLTWTLEKWLLLCRGIPRRMVNGWYDIFSDREFDVTDRHNIYGLPGVPYPNVYRRSKHRSGDYPFEFDINGPPE